jgi:hypothetical protein
VDEPRLTSDVVKFSTYRLIQIDEITFLLIFLPLVVTKERSSQTVPPSLIRPRRQMPSGAIFLERMTSTNDQGSIGRFQRSFHDEITQSE